MTAPATADSTPTAILERISLVLDAFDGPGRLTLAQVVRRTGLPRSSAHRMLERLVEMRWLRREGRDYELGTRLMELGSIAVSTRSSHMGDMVASRTGAAFTLARVLEADGNIGALVDQKFINGVPTTFYGRPCLTSPLVPKLARHYDCDVYPARCIRLSGGRYRLEVMDRIDLPRDAAGTVDVEKTAQLLNDVVEGWVRQDPGQWMWFHKRWQIR